jgi:hypothetical protein
MKVSCLQKSSKRMVNGISGKMGKFAVSAQRCMDVNPPSRCPGGESVEDMQCRVDTVIAKARPGRCIPQLLILIIQQVRQYHKNYIEEGAGTRDVVIVAHGHFNRVFISRWVEFPLALGSSQCSNIPLLLLSKRIRRNTFQCRTWRGQRPEL